MEPPSILHNCTIASIGRPCAIVYLAPNHQRNKLPFPNIYCFPLARATLLNPSNRLTAPNPGFSAP